MPETGSGRHDAPRHHRPPDINSPYEEPLPDLVLNAYYLLGYDWGEAGQLTPPVMITVCNRTETAARVKHAFDSRRIHIEELCDPERILHIDSKVLDEAEAQDGFSKLTTSQKAELLRQTVNTVGKAGQPGEKIQKVISVGMLSEAGTRRP